MKEEIILTEKMVQQESQSEKAKFKTLLIEDIKYKTYFSKKFENRKYWKAADPTKICSFIPGSIIKVFVKPGQKVKKGADLLVMDAMKMTNTIRAHTDGTVREVNVKAGDKIPKGFVMVEIN
jgi:biotin carboxyl carrier protein